MTTELTVMRDNDPVMVSIKGASYEKIQQVMDAEMDQTSPFPGKAYSMKKGHFYEGYGKDAPKTMRFSQEDVVINAFNIIFAWRTFEDKRPYYPGFANPTLGQRLCDRDDLGQTDKTMWEIDELSGQPRDPFSKIAIIPFRFEGETEVHHFQINNWSGVKAAQKFLRDFSEQGRRNMGKLPVVEVGTETKEHWEKANVSWEVLTFEIVDWADPIAEDEPEGAVSVDTVAKPATDGGVTSSSRIEAPKDEPEVIEKKRTRRKAAAKPEPVATAKNDDDPEPFPGMEQDLAEAVDTAEAETTTTRRRQRTGNGLASPARRQRG